MDDTVMYTGSCRESDIFEAFDFFPNWHPAPRRPQEKREEESVD